MEPLRPYSSKHIGVRRKGKGYQAQITRNKVTYRLGTFDNEDDAARAYNTKAIELDGPGTRLNDIDDSALALSKESPHKKPYQCYENNKSEY